MPPMRKSIPADWEVGNFMLGPTFGNLWNVTFGLRSTFGKDLELLGNILLTFNDFWGLLVRIP